MKKKLTLYTLFKNVPFFYVHNYFIPNLSFSIFCLSVKQPWQPPGRPARPPLPLPLLDPPHSRLSLTNLQPLWGQTPPLRTALPTPTSRWTLREEPCWTTMSSTETGWTGCTQCHVPPSCSASSISIPPSAASSWWSVPCCWFICRSHTKQKLPDEQKLNCSFRKFNIVFVLHCLYSLSVFVDFRHQAGWFPFRAELQNPRAGEGPQDEAEQNQDLQEMVSNSGQYCCRYLESKVADIQTELKSLDTLDWICFLWS